MKYRYLLAFSIIGLAMGMTTYFVYNYYAPPKIRSSYTINRHQDDTLRVAYIGDSWAFMHKDFDGKLADMLENRLKKPVKVKSFGICGLTSKEIYEFMFDNPDMRQFLQQGYDYAFISAGINDTYKKMSTRYYQRSMQGIITLLTDNHIHPIILEIPDFDIQRTFQRQQTNRKILRRLSMIVNDCPIDCKQLYREAQDQLIQEKHYSDKISVVRYRSWNKHYVQDLQEIYTSDGMHLNSRGYLLLDKSIAEIIISIGLCIKG